MAVRSINLIFFIFFYILEKALPFKLHFVAKKQLFRIPLLGTALHTMGSIPIDRGNLEKAKESLNKAGEIIKTEKKSVCIAPEGTRRRKNSDEEPRIARFKKGFFNFLFIKKYFLF